MRIAFLSDIHANLEAFSACLADVRAKGCDRIVLLGDIVGYGADPSACIDLVREQCRQGALAIRGNHDEAVSGSDLKLNDTAKSAIDWTRAVVSREEAEFLGSLPLSLDDEGRHYVHASARTPQSYPYILSAHEAADSFAAGRAEQTFVGHVHRPALYTITSVGKLSSFTPVSDSAIPLLPRRRWLAVVGSVGQPRDGNPAAAYSILDTSRGELSFQRVAYDVEKAASKIRAAGLPERLAKRLLEGN